ncbi:MAG: hypothetical protein COA88_02555 [Kordia sp.]|nr:MAG: hypothetical protein COA88_02555 [Kordia sp.]
MSETITNMTRINQNPPTPGTTIPNTLPLEPALFSITKSDNSNTYNIVVKVLIDATLNPDNIKLETDGVNFYVKSPEPTINPPANFIEYTFNIYNYPSKSFNLKEKVNAYNTYTLPNNMAERTEPETVSPPFEGTVLTSGDGEVL